MSENKCDSFIRAGLRINDNNYTWVDDTAVEHTNWAPAQPNHTVGQWCGSMTKALSWMWDDTDCKRDLPYICEYGKHIVIIFTFGLVSRADC